MEPLQQVAEQLSMEPPLFESSFCEKLERLNSYESFQLKKYSGCPFYLFPAHLAKYPRVQNGVSGRFLLRSNLISKLKRFSALIGEEAIDCLFGLA